MKNNENTLIMTVGLPRSGKSTWAKNQGYPIICPDSIRLALHGQPFVSLAEPFVWAIAKVMVRALFLSGHKIVILDSTAVTKNRRVEWESDFWTVKYKVFETSAEECIKRAKYTNQDYLIPIINNMHKEYESLNETEKII